VLEAEGITTNLTLLFSLAQAAAAADAGVTLISPFVGRIADWHKAKGATFDGESDPGVASVRSIVGFFRSLGAGAKVPIVMGASFRNVGQIRALAGADRLTISPALLAELAASTEATPRRVGGGGADDSAAHAPAGAPTLPLSEKEFRWRLNEDACATEKLAEGIRAFAADLVKLEDLLRPKLAAVRK
jgi:transaldolase